MGGGYRYQTLVANPSAVGMGMKIMNSTKGGFGNVVPVAYRYGVCVRSWGDLCGWVGGWMDGWMEGLCDCDVM
ncbi:hypothetical protein IAQ61_004724 [Plenodomus lingam]|uniref:uncharacterized protein n=1 Tax=Leptosphaeria maculans TaxID=5022 RepID=UPI003329CF45|nr:hypothetical protein IAQ61_004724 [Plenodomus lingam]